MMAFFRMCVYVHTYVHIHTYIFNITLQTRVLSYVYTYLCMYVCVCIYSCLYMAEGNIDLTIFLLLIVYIYFTGSLFSIFRYVCVFVYVYSHQIFFWFFFYQARCIANAQCDSFQNMLCIDYSDSNKYCHVQMSEDRETASNSSYYLFTTAKP